MALKKKVKKAIKAKKPMKKVAKKKQLKPNLNTRRAMLVLTIPMLPFCILRMDKEEEAYK